MESELLKIIFNILDIIEQDDPYLRDETLKKISVLYGKDLVDTTNCYLDYTWADIDGNKEDEVIKNYIKE